jgi:hypothetical protein
MNSQIEPKFQGYHTNNIYDNFPPLMSDGREISDAYQPEAVVNNMLLKQTGITSNWEYRQYLTRNGREIMNFNYVSSTNDVGYFKRYQDTPGPYNSPYLYKSYLDNTKPPGYQNSDAKELYLTRQQLDARMVAPVITQDEIIKYSSAQTMNQTKANIDPNHP